MGAEVKFFEAAVLFAELGQFLVKVEAPLVAAVELLIEDALTGVLTAERSFVKAGVLLLEAAVQ